MPLRVVFVGFQHGHAYSLYSDLERHSDVQIVAVCEEDPAVRDKAAERGRVATHTSYTEMLRDIPCDAVACCDYYGIRGDRMIQAMEAGKHVIADKPICTTLDSLARMQDLANAKHLKVGCQFPLPYAPALIAARDLIMSGEIGDVQSVTFNGAHSLNYEGRPEWMFDPKKYGGSINDIAIHGLDVLPWMTGREFSAISTAREWNARVSKHPKFGDGAVLLCKLDNGGAAYGDVSWFSPDKAAYKLPYYWRFTILGSAGAIETGYQFEKALLYKSGESEPREVSGENPADHNYVGDFLLDIANTPALDRLHTKRILKSARTALIAQQAADTGKHDLEL
ncbi:MAG TPA: Gfo/Idh/MocA family oxidoreductase [Candidatus Hydrogenedentes bacterium]|nr:Gfo/Idh/MocA family oxidoreductase [Candidatus Hydrogenedentota bacterium]